MLKTLVKLRLKEMFLGMRNRSNKGNLGEAGMIILLFFAGISFLFIFSTMAFGLGIGIVDKAYSWLYFGMMAILMFMLSCIGTVFMTKQQMFEAKDNAVLLSMPIKPRDILISRLISIGIMDYTMGFLIGLPFGVVYLFIKGYSVIGFIFFVIGIFLIPLLSLSVSVFFGWVLAAISRRMKHKNIVTMIFSSVFLMIYFYLCFSWQDRVEALVENGEIVAEALAKYLAPVYYFGKSVVDGNLLSFIIFALICIIPFIVSIALVSKSFIKIITEEKGAARIEYKGGSMKTSSEFMALSGLELKRFVSSPTYMLNAGMGLMFILLAAVFAVLKRSEFFELLGEFGFITRFIAPGIIIALLYMGSLTIISSGTISLEAKTLWIPKSIPVDIKNVLLAKAFPHIVISIPVLFVASIVLQFLVDISIVGRIMIVIVPIIGTVFNALLGVIINLLVPKFNWINEAQAIKQGLAPFLAMVVSAVPPVIFTILIIIVGMSNLINMDVLMIIYAVIYIIGVLLLYVWIIKKGTERLNRL